MITQFLTVILLLHPMTMSHLVNKIVNYFLLHCSWEGGGGAVSSDFKWWGWFNGAKINTPKNSWAYYNPPPKKNQKPHAKFLSYFTWLHFAAEICEHYHESSDYLNTKKNPYLNQAASPKNTCQIFLTKKSRNWKFQPPKNPFCHCHFKSGVPLLGHCWTAKITM